MHVYEWFYSPESNFNMFGIIHILTLLFITSCMIAFYLYRHNLRPYRDIIRIVIGWTLIFSRLSLDAWYLITNNWTLDDSLPLQLCSISSVMCGIMLLTKSRPLFEVFYFLAVGGSMQAMLTPNLGFGFPQYRFLQFFLSHALIFIAPLILCWLYHFKITKRSLLKSLFFVNVLALIIYFINRSIGSNYLYLMGKPDSASLLDVLGPYPYYIISLEVVAFIIFILLYLPFFITQKEEQRQGN